jgi:nucleotide sugar dehydrogenase
VKICVIALGKIGLPLAVQFASTGHDVVGVDVNQKTVDIVNAGMEPFPGEAELGVRLPAAVRSGRLCATTEYADAVPGAEAVVVVVPLFVDGAGFPDFAAIDSATQDVAAHLTPNTLVSYETTLPVGTIRRRVMPMLEQGSGLVEGRDFHLVFSPERVLTGRVFADLRKYPKLVGGLSTDGARRAAGFYEAVLEFDPRPDLPRPNGVWVLGSAEAAEMAKLAETTYRDVNIGLANQFARFAGSNGIDVYEVIQASNSQPYSHVHRPGVAVGGHCIPVYPQLYLWNDPDATVVRAARHTNAAMPDYVVGELEKAYGDLAGARVAVLGASYRAGVKEAAFSGVFPVVEALQRRNADSMVHDPMYGDAELETLGLTPYAFGQPVDAAVVQTDHDEYREISATDLPGVRVLVDGRDATDPSRWHGVIRRVIGVG